MKPKQFDALLQMVSAMIDQRITYKFNHSCDMTFDARAKIKAANLRSDEMIDVATALLVEQPAKEMPTINRICTSKKSSDGSGSPQIPCDGHVVNGKFYGGCGEPCRWMMQKSGEGYPPW